MWISLCSSLSRRLTYQDDIFTVWMGKWLLTFPTSGRSLDAMGYWLSNIFRETALGRITRFSIAQFCSSTHTPWKTTTHEISDRELIWRIKSAATYACNWVSESKPVKDVRKYHESSRVASIGDGFTCFHHIYWYQMRHVSWLFEENILRTMTQKEKQGE